MMDRFRIEVYPSWELLVFLGTPALVFGGPLAWLVAVVTVSVMFLMVRKI